MTYDYLSQRWMADNTPQVRRRTVEDRPQLQREHLSEQAWTGRARVPVHPAGLLVLLLSVCCWQCLIRSDRFSGEGHLQ